MEGPGGQGLTLGHAPGEGLAGELFLVLSDCRVHAGDNLCSA